MRKRYKERLLSLRGGETHGEAPGREVKFKKVLDYQKEAVMEAQTVIRDGEKDLRFSGEVLAGNDNKAVSGPNSNRWTELTLYRTAAGKYVAEEVHRTCWEGETDSHRAEVLTKPEDVVTFFCEDVLGESYLSNLAKRLIAYAGKKDPAFKDAATVAVD